MSARTRGLIVAALQITIVCSLAGTFYVDRLVRPRVWVRTAGCNPRAVIRGRYVRLGLVVEAQAPKPGAPVHLNAENGRLTAEADARSAVRLWQTGARTKDWSVGPVAFFIPEGVPDPTVRKPGEELWAEVTVPRRGLPRPIRLAVKRDGRFEPLVY